MKIEDIEEMWISDANILAEEEKFKQNSLRIPIFHAKYDNILSREECLLAKLQKEYNYIRMLKYNMSEC